MPARAARRSYAQHLASRFNLRPRVAVQSPDLAARNAERPQLTPASLGKSDSPLLVNSVKQKE